MGEFISPHRVTRGSAELEEKRLLIDRIAGSELFQRSPRLRDFLLYVADCTLENRLAEVREQVIAERVFGRKLEQPGGQDSIVRAEARNLRKRLETYFATAGSEEPVLVAMPKGGYSLVFQARPAESKAAIPADEAPDILLHAAPAASLVLPAPRGSGRFRSGYFTAALALLLAIATALAVYWDHANRSLRERVGGERLALPFSALLGDDREMLIVTSDTGLLQISALAHRRITLDEYMARSYPPLANAELAGLERNWNLYEFTDGREMTVAGRIVRDNALYARRISLRSGHEVQLEDFKTKSIVLIGSPISNPWAQLYEEKMNFRCDLNPDGRIVFRNVAPRRREASQYPDEEDIRHNRTYARLVFIPRNSDSAAALLIAGTTAQSTEAAGEFVLDRNRLEQTLRAFKIDLRGEPRFFEILIRSNNFVGGAIEPEVVAERDRASAP